MLNIQKRYGLFTLMLLLPLLIHTQTAKEQKIQEERQNLSLPELPSKKETSSTTKPTQPNSLDVDSSNVARTERILPNDGVPYFTLSGGLAPYQVSLGILKYFIPEWWGQLDINLAFIPSVSGKFYYTAIDFLEPYVAFKATTGWAFYHFRIFEISLIAQLQVVFVSTEDIPIVPSLGFRFIFDLFYIDVALAYAVGVGSSTKLLFSGFYPAITLGFRF